MNSLLQQLFCIPHFSNTLISFPSQPQSLLFQLQVLLLLVLLLLLLLLLMLLLHVLTTAAVVVVVVGGGGAVGVVRVFANE